MSVARSVPSTLSTSGRTPILRLVQSRHCQNLSHRVVVRNGGSNARCSSTLEATSEKNQSRRQWLYERQKKDIISDDLGATLEAHRRSNAEQIVRYITVGNDAENESGQDVANGLGDGVLHKPLESSIAGTEDGYAFKSVRKFVPQHQLESGSQVPNEIHIGQSQSHANNGLTDQAAEAKGEDLGKPSESTVRKGSISLVKDRALDRMSRKKAKQNLAKGTYVKPVEYESGEETPYWPPFEEDMKVTKERAECLSRDIKHISTWMQLTSNELKFRKLQARTIKSDIEAAFDDVSLLPFGSLVSGLSTSNSDIDLAFTIPSLQKDDKARGPSTGVGRPANRKLMKTKLEAIGRHLRATERFTRPEYIEARFPLLRATHKGSGVDIQVVYNDQANARDFYIKHYLAEFHQLKDVYMVLKASLRARRLHEPPNGGIGSYPLLIMIVASFKLSSISPKADLASSLLTFLKFWAEFNIYDRGVAADPPQTFDKQHLVIIPSKEKKRMIERDPILSGHRRLSRVNPAQPWALCLQDPADPLNDLGKRTFRIMDIKKTFEVLNRQTTAYLHGAALQGTTATGVSELGRFFGFTLGELRDQRKRFEDWYDDDRGRKIVDKMEQTSTLGRLG